MYIQSNEDDDALVLSDEHNQLALQAIYAVLDEFPDTVVFTKAIAKWLFARKGVFENSVSGGLPPAQCQAEADKHHKHVLLGGQYETRKTCGHPSIKCETCRLYTVIFSGFLQELRAKTMTAEDAVDYLEAHEAFAYVFEGHKLAPWSQRLSKQAKLEH